MTILHGLTITVQTRLFCKNHNEAGINTWYRSYIKGSGQNETAPLPSFFCSSPSFCFTSHLPILLFASLQILLDSVTLQSRDHCPVIGLESMYYLQVNSRHQIQCVNREVRSIPLSGCETKKGAGKIWNNFCHTVLDHQLVFDV